MNVRKLEHPSCKVQHWRAMLKPQQNYSLGRAKARIGNSSPIRTRVTTTICFSLTSTSTISEDRRLPQGGQFEVMDVRHRRGGGNGG